MAHLLHQIVYDDPMLGALAGGDMSLRTWFDAFCSEWSDTTIQQKASAFRRLIFVHGLSLKQILDEFCKLWGNSVKTYIITDTHYALGRIYEWAIEHDHELADKFGEIIEDSNVRTRINDALAGANDNGS